MKDHTQIVRRNLAYFWSVVGALFLFYAAAKWGDGHPEIQTLLIGFVLGGGVVTIILAPYFTVSAHRTPPAAPAIEEAGNVTVNNGAPPADSSSA